MRTDLNSFLEFQVWRSFWGKDSAKWRQHSVNIAIGGWWINCKIMTIKKSNGPYLSSWNVSYQQESKDGNFSLIFWLVPKNLNPSFSCSYCEYALKILDKDMLKLCYSLMLFPLMILQDLKKIINSLESSTPKKNLYFYRLVVIIGVLFRKYLLFLTNVK